MALVNHWDMQETSGTLADSVGGNTATVLGGATHAAAGPNAALPNAIAFDSSTIRPISLTPVTLAANADWSIAWWAIQDVDNTEGILFGEDADTDDYVFISSSVGGRLRFRSSAGVNTDWTILAGVRNKWSHYSLTYDGTAGTPELTLYVDGVLDSAIVVSPAITIDTFGNGYTTANFALDGSLADFRIYDTVLTAAEVSAVYTGTTRRIARRIARRLSRRIPRRS